MKRKEYSAGAVSLSFWFLEMKKVIGLLAEGKTLAEIKQLNKEENILNAATAYRSNNIMNAVVARLKAIGADSDFIKLFLDSDLKGQKLMCFIAIMCNDTLFFDFVYEIVREKLVLGVNSYSDSDIRGFFATKKEQSTKVAGFSDLSFKRLSSVYKVYLAEAGIADRATEGRDLYPPIFDDELVKWLEAHELQPVIAALNGR